MKTPTTKHPSYPRAAGLYSGLGLATLLACVSAALWTGCSSNDSPGKVVVRFIHEAAANHWTNAMQLVTAPTAEAMRPILPQLEKELQGAGEVEIVEERIQGERALVRFKMGKDAKPDEIPLQKVNGRWKVDRANRFLMAAVMIAPWTGAGDQALELAEKTRQLEITNGAMWGKLGMMLYDGNHYDEATAAFVTAAESRDPMWGFAGLVWQGHILDLQNHRAAALQRYREANAKEKKPVVRHDQYGIVLNQKWVEARLKQPFRRNSNDDSDSPSGPPNRASEAAATTRLPRASDATSSLPEALSSKMIWVKPGTFTMGGADVVTLTWANDKPFRSHEQPTRVTLTRGFWMCKFEVTQGEFQDVMGFNHSKYTGDPRQPVGGVGWKDAQGYCARLTRREQQAGTLPAGYSYRLPTEAEWEYAARAGDRPFEGWDQDSPDWRLDDYAWHKDNSQATTHPVGQKKPNAWGLYDMRGNVYEYCQDAFGPLPGGSATDYKAPGSGLVVIRGGSMAHSDLTRTTSRQGVGPGPGGAHDFGFRVVIDPGIVAGNPGN